MFNAENDIEELYERTLRIAATTVLPVRFLTTAILVNDPDSVGLHLPCFTAGQEGSYAMIEHMWITVLVHPL
jgi:hypothetical protein